ncbi:MAG: hypothetical protein Q8S17_00205 [Humidesulfovibrio sp.]|nr:hypothetical protein [Humidesulfovibrio sp.]
MTPPHKALAATLHFPLPAFFPALVLFLALLSPCAAAASGALPWLAPGQQDNASATSANANASDANASGPSPQAATQNATQNGAGSAPAFSPARSGAMATAVPAAIPVDVPKDAPTDVPTDDAGKAQFEVLRQYFRRQLTLAEDFPEVFSRRVKSGETMAFTTMLEMQRRRGLLERFRAAEVDLSGLVFTRVTADPDLARIHVTGRYSFTLRPKALSLADPEVLSSEAPEAQTLSGPKSDQKPGPKSSLKSDMKSGAAKHPAPQTPKNSSVHETLEEDALFVLLPEQGQWKIYERREGWRP